MTDENYTIKEVSDILRVHIMSIRNWIKAGKIKSFKVGSDYRIKKSDLEEYIKNNTVITKNLS